MFREIDHIAVLVRDTGEALKFYRDTLGLPLLFSEELPSVGVRLTHLDAGNVRLQLVEPTTGDHPLRRQLQQSGEGLHHICFRVGELERAMPELAARGLPAKDGEPHPAPRGGRAAFLEPEQTRGVLIEITGS